MNLENSENLENLEDSKRLQFSKQLINMEMYPQIVLKLQDNSKRTNIEAWNTILEQNIPKKKFKKYLYCIVKGTSTKTHAIYIGKSKKPGFSRIKDHFKGLQKIPEDVSYKFQDRDKSFQKERAFQKEPALTFYERMFEKFFLSKDNAPIYLFIIQWNNSRKIKGIFPFDHDFNIDNGEAVIISTLNCIFPNSLINHDFISRSRWSKISTPLEIKDNPLIWIEGNSALELWENFCQKWFILGEMEPSIIQATGGTIQHVPLFKIKEKDSDQLICENKIRSSHTNTEKSPLLLKSDKMENLIIKAVSEVRKSFKFYVERSHKNYQIQNKIDSNSTNLHLPLFCDGLLYMVYFLRSEASKYLNSPISKEENPSDIVPIYIGKTEMLGRTGNYSGNLKGVHKGKNKNFFARWGNDSARHIGGLSHQFFKFPNSYPSTNYESWIEKIFDQEKREEGIASLKFPVYFTMKPWFPYNIEFAGKLRLFSPEMESYVIALTRHLFPEDLGLKSGR